MHYRMFRSILGLYPLDTSSSNSPPHPTLEKAHQNGLSLVKADLVIATVE